MSKIENPYGYIYVITNLINGKRYVGKNVFDNKSMWKSYMGSGVFIKQAIKKYGKENFKKDIIHICYSQEELEQDEVNIISFLNADNSYDYYNVVRNKLDFKKYNHTKKAEIKRKNSVAVYDSSTGCVYRSISLAAALSNNSITSIKGWCERNRRIIKEGTTYTIIHNNYTRTQELKSSNWYYIEDVWKYFKSSITSVPVIDIYTFKLYPSWEYGNKKLKIKGSSRSIFTIEQYKKYLGGNKKYKNKRYLRIDDFLLLYNTNCEVSLNNDIQKSLILPV